MVPGAGSWAGLVWALLPGHHGFAEAGEVFDGGHHFGAVRLEFELLAAAVEEEQETAGSARGHHAVGHGGHEVLEDVFEGIGFGLGDELAELGPLAAGAEGDFLLLIGGIVGLGGAMEAEGFRGVVAAELLIAVGGAVAAAAVVEDKGTGRDHDCLRQQKGSPRGEPFLFRPYMYRIPSLEN